MTIEGLKIGFSAAHASQVSGGVSEVLRHLGGALVDQGTTVRIFAGADEHIPKGTKEWQGLETEVFRTLPPRQFGFQGGLRQAVADWRPNIMHVHGLWMYPSWATHHWRKMNLPYIVSPHGMVDRWALANSAMKKKLAYSLFERACLEGAACLHALNEMEMSSIRDMGLRVPIAVITNGTDLPSRRAQRRRQTKTLLYLGRIHPKKGLSELLIAFAQARKAAPHWRLKIVGWDDGGYQETLQKLCDSLKISDAVSFPGPVFGAAKEASFREADAFILPSKSEGMPMAVLEAWSYELPVLMTAECNLINGFRNGAALQVNCDPKLLSAELTAFFSIPEVERHEIGVAGRDLVRKQYQWSSIAKQAISLYSWVEGRIGRPDFVHLNN